MISPADSKVIIEIIKRKGKLNDRSLVETVISECAKRSNYFLKNIGWIKTHCMEIDDEQSVRWGQNMTVKQEPKVGTESYNLTMQKGFSLIIYISLSSNNSNINIYLNNNTTGIKIVEHFIIYGLNIDEFVNGICKCIGTINKI